VGTPPETGRVFSWRGEKRRKVNSSKREKIPGRAICALPFLLPAFQEKGSRVPGFRDSSEKIKKTGVKPACRQTGIPGFKGSSFINIGETGKMLFDNC
jgi:hypothetical protein